METHIYGLIDPGNPDVIMYVGKSNSPKHRFTKYLNDDNRQRRPSPVHRWISKIKAENRLPAMIEIEKCDLSIWKERERFWIAEHRKINPVLLNVRAGGDGREIGTYREFCLHCGTKCTKAFPSSKSLSCPICRKSRDKANSRRYYLSHINEVKARARRYHQLHGKNVGGRKGSPPKEFCDVCGTKRVKFSNGWRCPPCRDKRDKVWRIQNHEKVLKQRRPGRRLANLSPERASQARAASALYYRKHHPNAKPFKPRTLTFRS